MKMKEFILVCWMYVREVIKEFNQKIRRAGEKIVKLLFRFAKFILLVLAVIWLSPFLWAFIVQYKEAVLTIVEAVVGFTIIFPFMALSLGRHNIIFSIIREGETKIIVHNKAFKKAVMRYMGFYLDKDCNSEPDRRRRKQSASDRSKKDNNIGRIRREDAWRRKAGKIIINKFFNKFMGGGLIYVGIWPFDTIYAYEFRWNALKEGKLVKHVKVLDYIFAKPATYPVDLEGVETLGMVPLNIRINLTIRITNPRKALFRTHQWFEFAVGRITPYIRQFIPFRELEFEDLIKQPQFPGSPLFKFLESPGEEMSADMERLLREDGCSEEEIEARKKENWGMLAYLKNIHGINITGIEFASITAGKYEEAAVKKWEAEREKERIEVGAQAEANKINIVAEAEAKRIKTVSEEIIKQGEIGLAVKAMDTIEKASAKPGNWMFFPSNLLDFLKKIGGNQEQEKKGGDKK